MESFLELYNVSDESKEFIDKAKTEHNFSTKVYSILTLTVPVGTDIYIHLSTGSLL